MPGFSMIQGAKFSSFIILHLKYQLLSRVRLFGTPGIVAHRTSLSVGFSRQQCWGGQPSPSPGDFPNPGIEPRFPALQTDSLPSEPPGKLILSLIRSQNFASNSNYSACLQCDLGQVTLHLWSLDSSPINKKKNNIHLPGFCEH